MRIGMEAGNAQPLPTSSGAGFATASARKPTHGGKLSLFVVNGMTSTRQALFQPSHTPRITWVRFDKSSPRFVDDAVYWISLTFECFSSYQPLHPHIGQR